VRARGSFEEGADDRSWNIITLCPNCHSEFDDARIGISRDKRAFVVLKADGTIEARLSQVSIAEIKDEYVEWKVQRCVLRVRLALGAVPGFEHYLSFSLRGGEG